MLIYRGHGYWVFLLPLLTLGVFVHAEKGLPVFAANKRLWVVAALASVGLVCALWGLLANRGRAVQALDRLTGLIVTMRVRHSLYGISMQYWGGPGGVRAPDVHAAHAGRDFAVLGGLLAAVCIVIEIAVRWRDRRIETQFRAAQVRLGV